MNAREPTSKPIAIAFLVAMGLAGLAALSLFALLSPLGAALPVHRAGVWLPEGPLAVGGLALLGLVGLGWGGLFVGRS